MKISYTLLNTLFDGKLPPARDLEDAFTFHSWEIDEVIEKDGDVVFDVKVLPDKSAWALSHRGVAKDLSVALAIPLAHDPFAAVSQLNPKTDALDVSLKTARCDRYAAAYITGVTVGPSPEWLVRSLATLGQRSINNIVDATNYVMFMVGQPLHAFDAGKLSGRAVAVRDARNGEQITTLTGETYTLSAEDAIIVDGGDDTPIGIAGIKGGKHAEIDAATADIIIESAHFDAVSIRKTSQRLRLRTDASQRFENGVVADTAAYALEEVVRIILEVARGSLVGYTIVGSATPARTPVAVSIGKINSVLGLSLDQETIDAIFSRFGYVHTWEGETITVTPPFERPDLTIPEDLIEEVGRMYGYDHVASRLPKPVPLPELNTTFYYANAIREALAEAGFSEIFTSSFAAKDEVALKNAFASDKGCLRSTLTKNMREALAKNAPNADLLQLRRVAIFEIGTVFAREGESLHIALGVQSPSGYKAKTDDPVLTEGRAVVARVIDRELEWQGTEGVAEADLSSVLPELAKPTAYAPFVKTPDATYRPFSSYPFVSRDIAFWVPEEIDAEKAEAMLRDAATRALVSNPDGVGLLQYVYLFDSFTKEGKTSLAFRLIFQSFSRTLTATEVDDVMKAVSETLALAGFSIR